ncbi:hypothetical protein BH09MYX1_BH09MYX1_12970 [soil metagenome]
MMMRAVGPVIFALSLVATVVIPGCIAFNLGSKKSASDAGATDAAKSDAATTDTGTSSTPQGADCGQDPYTGVTLCSAISTCPTIYVDYDLYPECGFRIHGSVIDLECACYGKLCPIGVTTSCTEAANLLASQSQYSVCAQINEGRCTSK